MDYSSTTADKGLKSYHIYFEDKCLFKNLTEEEFEDHILEHMPHPDIYEQDLSYIGKRREEYPDEVEQLDALWKMVAHLKANGTDIGADAEAILDTIEAAKVKYPKPAALT